MPELDRLVAGLRCREVLADLSAYLDGELTLGRARQIEEHVRNCDWCEHFGGEFSEVIARFRRELREVEPLEDTSVAARLRPRLRADLSNR